MKWSVFLLVSVVVCVATAGRAETIDTSSNCWPVVQSAHLAMISRNVLAALYVGDTNRAVRILEIEMDGVVTDLTRLRKDGADRRIVRLVDGTLDMIAIFRRQFPPHETEGTPIELPLFRDQRRAAEQILAPYGNK